MKENYALDGVYRTRLKSWFLAAFALQHFFCLHSRLVHAQWSLAPDKKIAQLPCQNSNFWITFGIWCLLNFEFLFLQFGVGAKISIRYSTIDFSRYGL